MGDGKAEATASVVGRTSTVASVEALEDALGLRRRDTGPFVFDLEPRAAVARARPENHLPTPRRVANRVRDEISEHLPESLLVGLENRLRLLDVGLEADVSLGRMCSPVVDDPPDQVAGRSRSSAR